MVMAHHSRRQRLSFAGCSKIAFLVTYCVQRAVLRLTVGPEWNGLGSSSANNQVFCEMFVLGTLTIRAQFKISDKEKWKSLSDNLLLYGSSID
jgi:hypothetical protein